MKKKTTYVLKLLLNYLLKAQTYISKVAVVMLELIAWLVGAVGAIGAILTVTVLTNRFMILIKKGWTVTEILDYYIVDTIRDLIAHYKTLIDLGTTWPLLILIVIGIIIFLIWYFLKLRR